MVGSRNLGKLAFISNKVYGNKFYRNCYYHGMLQEMLQEVVVRVTLYIIIEGAGVTIIFCEKSKCVVIPEILEVHQHGRTIPGFTSHDKLLYKIVVFVSRHTPLSQTDIHRVIQ